MKIIIVVLLHILGSHNQIIHVDNDEHLLHELSTTYSDKLWFKHLEKPLELIFQLPLELVLNSWHAELSSKIYHLLSWCTPYLSYSLEQNSKVVYDHIALLAPCGYLIIKQGLTQGNASFQMYISKHLILQLNFSIFEMDLARRSCSDSSHAYICHRNNFGWQCPSSVFYCGNRRPWIETTKSFRIVFRVVQLNIRYPSNITSMYTSLDKQIAVVHRKHEKHEMVRWIHSPMSIICDNRISTDVHKWVLVFNIGTKFYFQFLETCCYAGSLELYDGFGSYYPLLLKQKLDQTGQQLNVSSQYHYTSLMFYVNSTYQFIRAFSTNQLFRLHYIRKSLDVMFLKVNEAVTINNRGRILHAIFGIKMRGGGFPNVSIITRDFKGWDENHCMYGGYSIKHVIASGFTNYTYHQGPFCPKALPSQPFIGTHGPKHIIFGKFLYFLIIYAFGPLYHIDIDIIMTTSLCEGLFEPVNMCSVALPELSKYYSHYPQFTNYFQGTNYRMLCYALRHENAILIQLSIEKITNCVIIQSISLFVGIIQHYTILTTLNITVENNVGPPFLTVYPITASSRKMIVIGSLSLSTKIMNLKQPFRSFFSNVGVTNFVFEDINQQVGLYMFYKFDAVNYMENCSRELENDHTKTAFNHTSKGVIEITSVCGSLDYEERSIYIFKFNIPKPDSASLKQFVYLQFTTKCTGTIKKNILSVVTSQGKICHSVDVLYKTMQVNHHFMPIHAIYEDLLGCQFSMEYRIRPFNAFAAIVLTTPPQSYLLVSFLRLWKPHLIPGMPMEYVILKSTFYYLHSIYVNLSC